MRILVLGASGMLGNAVFRALNKKSDWEVFGTIRSHQVKSYFSPPLKERLVKIEDVQSQDALLKLFNQLRPNVAINCISVARELMNSGDPLALVPIYALLPHRLEAICILTGTRLVHVSTDAVFTGRKGAYTEDDPADARDLYGVSKFIGELQHPQTITIRTSMIGHELQSSLGLIGWFLSQQDQCRCFGRAIFSGLPTVTLAQIIRDIVIPRPDLYGIYHVAGKAISKCELLSLVAKVYGKTIKMVRDDSIVLDRSLNGNRFQSATGFAAPDWPELIRTMRADWDSWATYV